MFTTVNNWICKDFIRNLFSRKYFVCINLYRNVFSQLDEIIRFRMLSYFFEEIHYDFGGELVIESLSVLKAHPLFLHEPLRLFTFLEMREEYLAHFPGVKIKSINHEKNK